MFSKREDEQVRPSVATQTAPPVAAERHEPAGIGPSITIVGNVSGNEDLTILGRVEGKIDLPKHSVTIGQAGHVKADIHAKLVSVAGEVHGNLVAAEQIVIRKTATMLGNLTAPRVGLEDGCCFRGSVEMETPPPKGRTAPASAPQLGGGTSPASPASPGDAAPKPEPTPRP